MTDAPSPSTTAGQVSDADLRISFDGPAILANRFFVTLGPSGVRIAFAEQTTNGETFFRSATILSVQDAIGLHRLLREMLQEIERQFDEAQGARSSKA